MQNQENLRKAGNGINCNFNVAYGVGPGPLKSIKKSRFHDS